MDALLGFVILTGPLWLILILLVVAGWGARKAIAHFNSDQRGIRVLIGVGIFMLTFLALFGDEIAGRIYFNYLCANESGVKVYQTVKLPAEYWDVNGKPKFYNEANGNYSLHKDYPTELKIEKDYSILSIDRLITLLKDQKKEKIFAERVSYMYWGGWLARNFNPSNTATSCNNDLRQYGNFIGEVFAPANSERSTKMPDHANPK